MIMSADLDLDDAESEAEECEYGEQLRRHGFCRVPLSQSPSLRSAKIIHEFRKEAQKLFLAIATHGIEAFDIPLNGAHGTHGSGFSSCTERDVLEIRLRGSAAGIDAPAVRLPPSFEKVFMQAWALLNQTSDDVLSLTLSGMGIDPAAVTQFIQHHPLPDNQESDSCIRISFYKSWTPSIMQADAAGSECAAKPETLDVCPAHTDVGVVTIVPISPVPGLECRSVLTREWKRVEADSDNKQLCDGDAEASAIIGDTLHQYSGGQLPAAVHRVQIVSGSGLSIPNPLSESKWSYERMSISFHVYMRPKSELDKTVFNQQLGHSDGAETMRVSSIYSAKAWRNSSSTLAKVVGATNVEAQALLRSFLGR